MHDHAFYSVERMAPLGFCILVSLISLTASRPLGIFRLAACWIA